MRKSWSGEGQYQPLPPSPRWGRQRLKKKKTKKSYLHLEKYQATWCGDELNKHELKTVTDQVVKMVNKSQTDHSNHAYLTSSLKTLGFDTWTFCYRRTSDIKRKSVVYAEAKKKKCFLSLLLRSKNFVNYWLLKPGGSSYSILLSRYFWTPE